MDCDLINSNIGACTDKTSLGFNRIGWWALYDDVPFESLTITDNFVSFLPQTTFFPIYDGSLNPFSGTMVGYETSAQHGYQLSRQTVKFPLRPHTVENVKLVNALARGKRIVVVLDQRGIQSATDGKYPIFGISGGLLLKTPISDWTQDVTWDLEFEDKNTSDNLLFLDASTANYVLNYEFITGLSLADGSVTPQQVTVEVDSDKTAYVVLPDNTILTSIAGIINYQWEGEAGSVVLIVPKINSSFIIGTNGNVELASSFNGILNTNATNLQCSSCTSLTAISAPNAIQLQCSDCTSLTTISAPNATHLYCSICTSLTAISAPNAIQLHCSGCTSLTTISAPNATYLYCYDCTSLTTISAPNATHLYCSDCGLTPKSIGDILYSAYDDNRENTYYDFTGGTNALKGEVDTYLQATYGITYATIYALLVTANGGIIVIDVV